MSSSEYAAVALVAGLLSLERKAFLQAMLSRPLIVGALTGAVVGWPGVGLSVGAALELFWLGSVNLGAALPDNELFGTVAATSFACAIAASTGLSSHAPLAAGALVALPAAKLGRGVDRLCERLNGALASRTVASHGAPSRLRNNLIGLWLPFAATAAVALAAAALGSFLAPRLFAPGPSRLTHALAFVWPVFLMIAAAVAIRSIRSTRAGAYAATAALLVSGLHWMRTGVL